MSDELKALGDQLELAIACDIESRRNNESSARHVSLERNTAIQEVSMLTNENAHDDLGTVCG